MTDAGVSVWNGNRMASGLLRQIHGPAGQIGAISAMTPVSATGFCASSEHWPLAERRRELGVFADQIAQLVVRVQAARVRQDECTSAREALGLGPDRRIALAGRDAVGADAEERDDARSEAVDLLRERRGALEVLLSRELGCRGGCERYDVGDADAGAEQLPLLGRVEQARAEPSAVQRLPEAVTRACEMVPDGRRVQARVDADEEDVELAPDEIRDALAARGRELGERGLVLQS